MTFDPALAVRLETALYADEFMADFDKLLRITGTRLRLVWDGPRDDSKVILWLRYDGQEAPLAVYHSRWTGFRWGTGSARVEDFRDRLVKLLQLHKAEAGLGISQSGQLARFNVGFPLAPRLNPTDLPLSRRVIYTRRSTAKRPCAGEYEAAP